jgi:hypothetical protein
MDQRTALHKAASCGHENVMELLTAYGAASELVDARGLTPAAVLAEFRQRQDKKDVAPAGSSNPSTVTGAPPPSAVEADTDPSSVASSSPPVESSVVRSTVAAPVQSGAPSTAGGLTAGASCPVCGNRSLLFTRFLRGGLVCLDCYSKR